MQSSDLTLTQQLDLRNAEILLPRLSRADLESWAMELHRSLYTRENFYKAFTGAQLAAEFPKLNGGDDAVSC